MNPQSTRSATGRALLIGGILLIAANLRAPFTGLPPLLGLISADLGLGTTAAGALTTLPLLAFALLSPFSAGLARRHGLERTLFAGLAAIALGIVLRSAGTAWCLYLGAWTMGMGIAVSNVLLPSLIKRDFPHNIAALTGAYALAMGITAALSSAVAIPLAQAWGWQGTLAAYLVLPLAALGVWATQLRTHGSTATHTAAPSSAGPSLWRSALAWQVTLFLGLNSSIYYVIIGWLPAFLAETGMSAAQAGTLHGAMQLATALPGLVLGPVLRRLRDQRLAASVLALCAALALTGLLALPRFAAFWTLLFGLSSGAWFILALALIGLRTGHAQQTAVLSGMAQSVGYLLAAAGPMAMGALHDTLGSWRLPLGVCIALAVVSAFVGALAGRDLQIGQAEPSRR